MKERLKEILEYYNLNSSRLAERLGVQRSGISHIMAGRNKPGYDFIKGILNLFPEIDANWLITGKGSMFKEESQEERSDESKIKEQDNANLFDGIKSQASENQFSETSEIDDNKDDYKSKHQDNTTSSIDSIIILLKNGKFRSYERE